MKLKNEKYAYLFNLSSSTIAGFTKNILKGELPQDIKKALSFLEKDLGVCFLNQLHSSKVNFVEKEGLYSGDGLFTKVENLVLVVKTADCLPIFFASRYGWIGIVHMGWQGAKEGILDNINFDLSSFKVVVGVGLRLCCYKVGEEFLRYNMLKDFIRRKTDGFYFDSISFIKEKLYKKGLKKDNFFDLGICSLCSKEEFFSYRRQPTSFRTLSFVFKKG
jgi:hypothetical protein